MFRNISFQAEVPIIILRIPKNPEIKSPLGRPRRRWEDNIKMDLREVGCKGMDWIDLAQDRDIWRALANAVNEPSRSIKCGEFLD
jgi:hypothetical protein